MKSNSQELQQEYLLYYELLITLTIQKAQSMWAVDRKLNLEWAYVMLLRLSVIYYSTIQLRVDLQMMVVIISCSLMRPLALNLTMMSSLNAAEQ